MGQGLIEWEHGRAIATPKKECGSRTALRPDEYTGLLAIARTNPRDWAILQAFLKTGIRASDLESLIGDDVDFESR